MPNGDAVIFVVDTAKHRLSVLLDQLSGNTSMITHVDLHYAADNVAVEKVTSSKGATTVSLLLGSIGKIAHAAKLEKCHDCASVGGVSRVQVTLLDNGKMIARDATNQKAIVVHAGDVFPGTAGGVEVNGHIVMGSYASKGVLVCDAPEEIE